MTTRRLHLVAVATPRCAHLDDIAGDNDPRLLRPEVVDRIQIEFRSTLPIVVTIWPLLSPLILPRAAQAIALGLPNHRRTGKAGVMKTLSPWATKSNVEATREKLKADASALHADLRATQALLAEHRERRPWWPRLFAAGAVAIVAMIVGTVGARAEDGMRKGALYDFCSKPERSGFTAHCFAYVMAISDVMRDYGTGVYGLKECSAVGVSLKQRADVVKGYLAAHRESRDQAASSLVAQALAEAFPCK